MHLFVHEYFMSVFLVAKTPIKVCWTHAYSAIKSICIINLFFTHLLFLLLFIPFQILFTPSYSFKLPIYYHSLGLANITACLQRKNL